MDWIFLIFLIISAVLSGAAARSSPLTSQSELDLVYIADEVYSSGEELFTADHRLLQDNQRQRDRNQNQSRNRNQNRDRNRNRNTGISPPTSLQPTSQPSLKPNRKPTPEPTFECRRIGRMCYGYDDFCCSRNCGEDGTCHNACQPNGDKCFGIHEFCCSGLCDANGICVSMTEKPTRSPTRKPTTDFPTLLPTNLPSQSLSPTSHPTFSPSASPSISAATYREELASKGFSFTAKSTNGCQSGMYKLKVRIQTDKYGSDVAWSLTDSSGNKLYNVKEKTYEPNSLEAIEMCVNAEEHTFRITDNYGDGVCCAQGKGYIKLYLDDREIMHITAQYKDLSFKINVGYNPTLKMKERDYLYLEAHNKRREVWHKGYNTSYVPLIWSNAMAESARVWAETQLVNCSIVGVHHDKSNPYGENLAKNTGESHNWGQLYPPDLIVGRWIDREVGLPYPSNAHLTAALWRGSKYVGCGESELDVGINGKCRIQVCRYARPCNCGMEKFHNGTDWLIPMLDDTSKCGPDCPPEGCY